MNRSELKEDLREISGLLLGILVILVIALGILALRSL